jgi:hypothetical protein
MCQMGGLEIGKRGNLRGSGVLGRFGHADRRAGVVLKSLYSILATRSKTELSFHLRAWLDDGLWVELWPLAAPKSQFEVEGALTSGGGGELGDAITPGDSPGNRQQGRRCLL